MAGILGNKEKREEIKKPRHYIRIAREISAVQDAMDRAAESGSNDTEGYERLRLKLEKLKEEYDDSYDFYHNPERQKEYYDSLPWYKKILIFKY